MDANNKTIKITVITVCFNAEKHIEGAIQSVLVQTYPNIEYIIVDGASTDGTLVIVEKYKDRIYKIVSEKDRGIYDAMNKGVQLATGDVVYFLNADDRLFNANVIADIVKVFNTHKEADLVIGKVEPVNMPASFLSNKREYQGECLSKAQLLINGLCHQRVFAKTNLFKRIGFLKWTLRYSADFDWILRAYKSKAVVVRTDCCVAFYDVNGFSTRNWWGAISDHAHVVFCNANLFEFIFYLIYVSLRKIIRTLKFWLKRT